MKQCVNSLTIGIFDGLHIGHRRLVSRTVSQKRENGDSVMLTFEYPPEYYFGNGDKFRGLIYPPHVRREIAVKLGIDRVEFLDFRSLKDYSANEFVDLLFEKYAPCSVTVGFNFRFGKGKSGNTAFLYNKGRKLGFKTGVIQPVLYSGHKVSSTLIRHYLRNGEIGHANEILCDSYALLAEFTGKRNGIYVFRRNGENLVSPADGIYLISIGECIYGVMGIRRDGNLEEMEILFEEEMFFSEGQTKKVVFLETLSLDGELKLESAKKEIEQSNKLISFLKKNGGWC